MCCSYHTDFGYCRLINYFCKIVTTIVITADTQCRMLLQIVITNATIYILRPIHIRYGSIYGSVLAVGAIPCIMLIDLALTPCDSVSTYHICQSALVLLDGQAIKFPSC